MFLAIMVLPRPLLPTSARLRPSRMKSRVSARSMRSRSILLGQFQSKSAIGLKRPMRALLSRLSRLRRLWSISSKRTISSSICMGDIRLLVTRARKSSRMRAMASSPILSRRSLRLVGVVVAVVVVAANELIVGLRGMGFDVEVLEVGPAREIDRGSEPSLSDSPSPGEEEDDRADVGSSSGEGLVHRDTQLRGPVVVEQEQELLRDGGDTLAPLEAGLEQRLRLGDGADQSGIGRGPVRSLLFREKRLDVGRVIDLAVPVVAAGVAGDLGRPVEDAHAMLGSDEGQRPADGLGWDRVVVEVEADVDRLVGADWRDQVRLEGMLGQRGEVDGLFAEGASRGIAGVARPAPPSTAPFSLPLAGAHARGEK